MPNYIGIVGYNEDNGGSMFAGKDTVAGIIEDGLKKIGASSHVLPFAEHLKTTAAYMFQLSEFHFYDQEWKSKIIPEYNMTPREILQVFGTDCVRKHFGDDFWINATFSKADKMKEDFVIIPDIRFQNEIDAVKAKGGKILGVRRKNSQSNGQFTGHSSENTCLQLIEQAEIEFINDSTLENLKEEVYNKFLNVSFSIIHAHLGA